MGVPFFNWNNWNWNRPASCSYQFSSPRIIFLSTFLAIEPEDKAPETFTIQQ